MLERAEVDEYRDCFQLEEVVEIGRDKLVGGIEIKNEKFKMMG